MVVLDGVPFLCAVWRVVTVGVVWLFSVAFWGLAALVDAGEGGADFGFP